MVCVCLYWGQCATSAVVGFIGASWLVDNKEKPCKKMKNPANASCQIPVLTSAEDASESCYWNGQICTSQNFASGTIPCPTILSRKGYKGVAQKTSWSLTWKWKTSTSMLVGGSVNECKLILDAYELGMLTSHDPRIVGS